jgi:hypothetical protein
MKMNYKALITVVFATASLGCAQGQSVAPAGVPGPSDAPAVGKGAPRTTPRLRGIAGQTPYAQNEPVTALDQYQNAIGRFGSSYGLSSRSSSDSVPPVVIQFGAKDGNAISAMEEDLSIMTHIIDRALDRMGEDGVDQKLGVRLYYTSGGRSVRALYLDGFGPLFMVKVNFPVHAAATTAAKAPEQPENSEWEVVKNELFGGGPEVQWSTSSSAVPYDDARVEVLKKNLLHALKNASNMKGVRADEYVNVSVFGSPALTAESGFGTGGGGAGTANNFGNETRADKRDATAAAAWTSQRLSSRNLDQVRASLQGTVLTLRAKKSDIDAAAKGSLDDEAFAKKVAINTYTGNGYGLTSVNSWVRKSSTPSSAVAR